MIFSKVVAMLIMSLNIDVLKVNMKLFAFEFQHKGKYSLIWLCCQISYIDMYNQIM